MKTSNTNFADVASLDAIITAAYDSISAPAGKKRDWIERVVLSGARHLTAKPGANDGLAPQIRGRRWFLYIVEPYFASRFLKKIAGTPNTSTNTAHYEHLRPRHARGRPEPFCAESIATAVFMMAPLVDRNIYCSGKRRGSDS